MQPLERIDAPVRVAAAIWLGATRLTDNLLCTPPAFQPQAGVDRNIFELCVSNILLCHVK
jgi:hypothetical protein